METDRMLALSTDHRSSYNRLLSVREATEQLRNGHDLNALLGRLGDLTAHAGLEKVLAIRLLHRHNGLKSDDVMVERLELLDGQPALTTLRMTAADVGQPCIPSVWRCGRAGEIEPLEFGYASLYSVEQSFLEKHRRFFAKFAAATSEMGVFELLGLCLQSNALEADEVEEILTEYTDSDRDANVVVVRPRAHEGDTLSYDTTWKSSGSVITTCKRCEGNPLDPNHPHDTIEHSDTIEHWSS
jgi:hypothetical protein